MYGIEIDFAPSKPGASLRSAPGYRITPLQGFKTDGIMEIGGLSLGYRIMPRWGLENFAYAPTGHDEKAQGNALGKKRYKNNPKP